MHRDTEADPPPLPTAADLAAVVDLLADGQAVVAAAARARVLRWGDHALPAVRAAAEAGDARLRARCRSLLRSLEVRDCLVRLSRLRLVAAGRGSPTTLLVGAALLSRMARTFVPTDGELIAGLHEHARAVAARAEGRSLPYAARALAERLHGDAGWRGGLGGAAPVEQVAVDGVLATGEGAPVALSLLYLVVARWAGFSAAGVAMPGHFLVRLHGVRPVLVDPFHGGRVVTKLDCMRLLRRAGHRPVAPLVRDLGDRPVLRAYLDCLRAAVAQRPLEHAAQALEHAAALLAGA
ncbi:MAG: transglutaminase family protein [Planctomycetota bacterium]